MREQPYYFDATAADRVCRFFETQLIHLKGPYAGKPFKLLDWQRQILRDVFGWKRTTDDTRRYHTIYCEIPRKQGKTLFVSGLLLYLFCADGEPGAEVYAASCTSEQSGYAFKNCKAFVRANPQLRKRIAVYQHHLEHTGSGSILKGLSGESVGSHGKNIHGLSIDEYHEWKGAGAADLYEALTTSYGARLNHLTCIITTAGHGGDLTLCRAEHDRAARYISGEIKPTDPEFDDSYYAVIYAADPGDQWDDPETWHKANPSLGRSVPVSYLDREARKAKESPSKLNTFLRLYLNIWTEQQTRWLDLDQYDSRTAPVDLTKLEGQPVYCGLDLSQSYDLAALILLFPQADRWIVTPRLYIPKDVARRRSRDEGIPLTQWIDQGHLIGTDGPTVDYDRIERDILDIAETFQLRELAFDPYNASQLTRHLDEAGIVTVPVNQNYLAMSAACKEVERRLIADLITLDANPVLRWTAANVEVEQDKHGNIRPVKPRAKGKYSGTRMFNIDPIVATVIAASRAMLQSQEPETGDIENAIVWF